MKVVKAMPLKKKNRFEHKLYRACFGLGLNLIDITSLVQINDLPEVACWGYDKKTGEQFIYVNSKTLRLPVPLIQMVLRHEILHAAGYDTIGGGKEHELVNLALDVAINFVIYHAHRSQMRSLSQRIYPKASQQSALVLAQCHVERAHIKDPVLQQQWHDIWYNDRVPSPTAIYYQLLTDVPVVTIQMIGESNPFQSKDDGQIVLRKKAPDTESSDSESGTADGDTAGDQNDPSAQSSASPTDHESPQAKRDRRRKIAKLGERLWAKTKERLGEHVFSDCASEFFQTEDVQAEGATSAEVQAFLNRLELYQELDDTTRRVIEALGGLPSCQLYPQQLTKRSLVYIAAGLQRFIPFYWNRTPEQRKPRIAVYVDTSPSMDNFKQEEVYLMDQLASYFPTKIFCFAGSVQEIALSEFAAGKYPAGASTSFTDALEHFLAQSDDEACIFFTDGESGLTDEIQQRFVEARRRLFAVYFSNTQGQTITSSLDQIAEQTTQIHVV